MVSAESSGTGTLQMDFREALKLYVVTDSRLSRGRDNVEVVRQAIAGGARIIQLREKEASDRQLVSMGLAIRDITRAAGVFFIVNDRVDIAQVVDADGVHLGQDDVPADLARKILGPGKIVGVTVETPDEAREAEKAGASYVGTGPIFSTATKADAGRPYGIDLIPRIKRATSLPVVAIGGINTSNVAQVARAGADGVAVVSAVVSADDIARAVRELIAEFEKARRATGTAP